MKLQLKDEKYFTLILFLVFFVISPKSDQCQSIKLSPQVEQVKVQDNFLLIFIFQLMIIMSHKMILKIMTLCIKKWQ